MVISNISVPGGTICVEVAGEGPLVVCSPAMGDSRDAFAPFSRRLVEAGFRVASADLRGHGDSSTGFDSYGDEPTAQDMLAVVDELGGAPAILAGASMSAAAATIAAGREPAKVSGLLLFGPFLRGSSNPITRLAFRLAFARPWGPAISRLSSILKRKGHWAAFSKTARTDHAVVAPWFNRVTAPALVVMGAEDPDWKDPRAEASWAASQFAQGAFAMVEGVGHAPMLESPDVAAREAIAFASRIGFGGTHA